MTAQLVLDQIHARSHLGVSYGIVLMRACGQVLTGHYIDLRTLHVQRAHGTLYALGQGKPKNAVLKDNAYGAHAWGRSCRA